MIFNLQNYFTLYAALLFLTDACLVLCAYRVSKTKSEAKYNTIFVICAIFITIFAYAFYMLSSSYKNAAAMYTFFLFCTCWAVYTTFTFTMSFTNTIQKVGFVKQVFFILSFIDSISILANVRAGHIFYLEALFTKAGYCYWNPVFTSSYTWHRIICTIILLCSFTLLVISMVRAPSYYKIKYTRIAGGIFIVLLVSYVCLALKLPISFSPVVLAFITIHLAKIVTIDFNSPLLIAPLVTITETIQDAILCFDAEGKLVYFNSAAKNLFDKTDEQLEEFAPFFVKLYLREKPRELHLFLGVNNAEHFFNVEYKDIYIKDSIAGSYIKLQDRTTELKKTNELQHRATHDRLTGLYNRQGFFDRVKKDFEQNKFKFPVMIFTNIKDFKLINTLYGNEQGDEVLKSQADLLERLGRKKAIIGRLSDDKFAMVTDKKYFDKDTFEEEFKIFSILNNTNNFNIQLFAGIYEIYNKKENIQLIFDKAKIALDSLKEDSQQIFSFYDSAMMDKIIAEKNILNEFETALSERQFSIQLQPINTLNGKAIGAEAFVRWNHPTYQTIEPVDLISILEKTGLIYKLDLFVWNLAAKKLSDWKKKGITDKFISVNVSGKDKNYIDVVKTFTDLVKNYDIEPKNLHIEISETAIADNPKLSISIFDSLKALGFKIFIDKFGTGYSSLNMLKDFMADGIKMDTAFLAEEELSDKDRIILQTMISMSHSLGMQFIAKGVESKNHLIELSNMNCNYFQGFYFSHPLTLHDFETLYL